VDCLPNEHILWLATFQTIKDTRTIVPALPGPWLPYPCRPHHAATIRNQQLQQPQVHALARSLSHSLAHSYPLVQLHAPTATCPHSYMPPQLRTCPHSYMPARSLNLSLARPTLPPVNALPHGLLAVPCLCDAAPCLLICGPWCSKACAASCSPGLPCCSSAWCLSQQPWQDRAQAVCILQA
jgi:hypothetical protein